MKKNWRITARVELKRAVLNMYLTKAELYREVERILAEVGIPVPCDPYRLAEQLKIPIEYKDLKNPKFCGALIRSKYFATVVLSNAHLFSSERFTLAHELGHYFLHDGVAQFFCEGDTSPLEWQANTFAAELLVPWRTFLPQIRDIAWMGGSTTELLHRLAKQYDVSPLIIRRRVDDLSHELWQSMEGVPVEFIKMASRTQMQQYNLPAGPSAADLFKTREAILDIYNEDAGRTPRHKKTTLPEATGRVEQGR